MDGESDVKDLTTGCLGVVKKGCSEAIAQVAMRCPGSGLIILLMRCVKLAERSLFPQNLPVKVLLSAKQEGVNRAIVQSETNLGDPRIVRYAFQ